MSDCHVSFGVGTVFLAFLSYTHFATYVDENRNRLTRFIAGVLFHRRMLLVPEKRRVQIAIVGSVYLVLCIVMFVNFVRGTSC